MEQERNNQGPSGLQWIEWFTAGFPVAMLAMLGMSFAYIPLRDAGSTFAPMALTGIGFFLVGLYAIPRLTKRLAFIGLVTGLMLASCLVYGKALYDWEGLPRGAGAGRMLLGIVIVTVPMAALVVALVCGLPALLHWLEGLDFTVRARRLAEEKPLAAGLCVFGLLMLSWLLVFFAMYPGQWAYDGPDQLKQWLNDDYNTHHPLLHTLFLQIFVQLGMKFDSTDLMIAGYALTQMTLLAGLFAYGFALLRRLGAGFVARAAALAFFVLFPVFGLFAGNTSKDILFAAFLALFLLKCVQLVQDPPAFFESLSHGLIPLLLFGALAVLLRNQGIYVILLGLPFCALAARSLRLRTAVLLLVAVLIGSLFNTALKLALDADDGDKREMYSAPMMMQARAYLAHAGELPEDEAALYLSLVALDEPDRYTPYLADYVKGRFYTERFDENRGEYLALWAKWGLRYPADYLEGFMLLNMGSWAINQPYVPVKASRRYIESWLFDLDQLEGLEEYPVERRSKLPRLLEFYLGIAHERDFENWPFLRYIFSTAFPFWLLVLAVAFVSYRGRYRWLGILVFPFVYWLTLLASPVVNGRYTYPFLVCMVFLGVAMTARLPQQGAPDATRAGPPEAPAKDELPSEDEPAPPKAEAKNAALP